MSGLSEPAGWLHLDWVLIVVAAWLLVGAVGVLALAPPGMGGQGAVSRRRRDRAGAVRRRARRAVLDARGRRAAARPAGAALPPSPRHPRRLLPDGDRRGIGRRVGVRRRLLPQGRRHAARTALPRVPPLSRQHGDGRAGRRRLRLHGDVGNDGAVVVLPRHRQSPPRRNPAGRLPVPAGRAHRRDRHPAVLRRAPGEHRRLHLRQHARSAPDAVLGLGGVPARPVRLRRQGGDRAAAHLAARGAPGRAVAGLGADERRDAEDRRLRAAARHLRPAAGAALVVGRDPARARPGERPVRRRLRRGPGRHEAAARLFVDREHRPRRSPGSAWRSCSRPTA